MYKLVSFCVFFRASGGTRALLFGGYDGLVLAICMVAGCAGGGLPLLTATTLGTAATAARAISVGMNELLSARAHRQYLESARRREMWEFQHFRDREIHQMTSRFVSRGMQRKEAELVVSQMAQCERLFVGLMVVEELGCRVPDVDEDSHHSQLMMWADALLMMVSFAFCGLFPFAALWFGMECHLSDSASYRLSIVVSFVLLLVVSLLKKTLSTASLLHALTESIALGAGCAAVAFALGSLGAQFVTWGE